MNLICALAGHEADRGEAYNGGFHFSRCRRCRCDMIRSSGEWQAVPEGHRVAWKAGRHSHSIEPDYARALPVLHSQSNLPAVRSGFASWSRHLSLFGRRRKEKAAPTAEQAEARVKEPYPKLIVLVALVGAGLQMLFGLGSRREEPSTYY